MQEVKRSYFKRVQRIHGYLKYIHELFLIPLHLSLHKKYFKQVSYLLIQTSEYFVILGIFLVLIWLTM